MSTYIVESVNGKTCRHRAGTVDEAARAHARLHINTKALAVTVPGVSRCWYQARAAISGVPLRQPFRVCGS